MLSGGKNRMMAVYGQKCSLQGAILPHTAGKTVDKLCL